MKFRWWCNLNVNVTLYGVFLVVYITLQLRSVSSPSELAQNEDILRIFLMACEVRSVKLSVIGLSCIQKLISHDAVSQSALKEILSTLKNVSFLLFFSVCYIIYAKF